MSRIKFKRYKGAGIAFLQTIDGQTFALMGKRKNKPHANTWSFLGGQHDKHETLEETAFREFREESGTEIDRNLIVRKKAVNIELIFFRWNTIVIESTQTIDLHKPNFKNEFSDTKFINLKELSKYKIHPFVRLTLFAYKNLT